MILILFSFTIHSLQVIEVLGGSDSMSGMQQSNSSGMGSIENGSSSGGGSRNIFMSRVSYISDICQKYHSYLNNCYVGFFPHLDLHCVIIDKIFLKTVYLSIDTIYQ